MSSDIPSGVSELHRWARQMRIDLKASAVAVCETDLVEAPSVSEFLSIVGVTEEACRKFPDTGSGNSFAVIDDLGIWFLISAATRRLVLFAVQLESPGWRPRSERDPKAVYSGEIAVGGRLIPRPITTSMAELIAKRHFATASVRMTPHGSTIASVIISFLENGKRPFDQN